MSQVIAGLVFFPWLLSDWRAKLVTKLYTPTTHDFIPTQRLPLKVLSLCLRAIGFIGGLHRCPRNICYFDRGHCGCLVYSFARFARLGSAGDMLRCVLSHFADSKMFSNFLLKEPLSVNPRYFVLYLPFTTLALAGTFVHCQKFFKHNRLGAGLYEVGGVVVALAMGSVQGVDVSVLQRSGCRSPGRL